MGRGLFHEKLNYQNVTLKILFYCFALVYHPTIIFTGHQSDHSRIGIRQGRQNPVDRCEYYYSECSKPLSNSKNSFGKDSLWDGTTTDLAGHFRIEKVPVGRHNLQITYLGYEPMILNNILVISGKELVLNVELQESAMELEVATVVAKHDKTKTLNEMATVSARSFSVEETARYASSLFDPARMAQNFAGVTIGASDDLFNEIIIRGNSPKGVLWRLEGIEIPNPNHFSSAGNSGGAISMLSSTTLSNSDFYTGAFPSEFGNALSGVFDLNMRNGNNEQREYAFMFGFLGIEGGMEGPFRKGSRASYLVNFRYSTLAAMQAVGLSPTGDVLPVYSDLSFKINVPTEKAGTFALFGLGGKNKAYYHPEPDSSQWDPDNDEWGFNENQTMGTVGLSHRYLLSDDSYLKTVVLASHEAYNDDEYWLDIEDNYRAIEDNRSTLENNSFRFSTTYTKKFDARNTLRTGLIFSHLQFNFTYDDDGPGNELIRYFDNSGKTGFLQGFAHWKHRFNDRWTFNGGVHYSQMTLNNNFSIEPRAAIQWAMTDRQTLSASVGLHSKMEHLAAYIFDGTLPEGNVHRPNKDLELSKAMHAVLGYDVRLGQNLRLKLETYYQHLYDVPIETVTGSKNSLINTFDIWDIIGADSTGNEGLGRNYGVDLTLEKFFSKQYYFLITGALYESQFSAINKKWYNTRFNGNYQLTLLGGKEFKVGKKKQNIIGMNGKFIISGGNRYTPVDVEASLLAGEQIEFVDRPFELRSNTYWRFDLGLSYKINKKKATHSIMIDIQNVTNHVNEFGRYFDEDTMQMEIWEQTGLFPNFNYRLEF